MMIVFMEESIVDHLNVLIPLLNTIFIEDDEQKDCKAKVASILRLCGRYSPASAFEPICLGIINLKLTENEELAICGLSTFRHLTEGFLEALPPREGFINKFDLLKSIFAHMGAAEFLDHLTKPMLTPFAEFFELVFRKVTDVATKSESGELFAVYKSQIVKIALTAISIPIFLLVTDQLTELNFRLVKSCIDNSSKLKTDKDAEPYLKIIKTLTREDPKVLLSEIYSINPSEVGRPSNDILVISSLMNYYLIEQDSEGFLDAALIFESAAKEKETMAKLILNLNCYCSFFVHLLDLDQRTDCRG